MFTLEILLVDDNPADLDLTGDILAHSQHPKRVSRVMNGAEALEFLRHEGKYSQTPDPDLIVLDLNLPRKDGRAVLAEVKSDPLLRRTPIVVFSTSQAEFDISQSYTLGANSYVTKPGDLPEFVQAVESIENFWFGCACLPRKEKQ